MTKLVLIGCTHGYHGHVKVPPCDILVHTGDSMGHGNLQELRAFLVWLEHQPAPVKVLIAGNHCRCFEQSPDTVKMLLKEWAPSVTYLQDSGATIAGLRFWGSPYTPTFLNWYHMRDRGAAIKRHWDMIPEGLDVLVTHGPATVGMLDYTPHGHMHVGDQDLYEAIQRTKPRYHVSSHIHAGYGHAIIDHGKGQTDCYNASICTEVYEPINQPWVIDL